MNKLTLTHIGRDNWERPVYISGDKLYVDVDPRKGSRPDICTKLDNVFDGEPDMPISAMQRFEGVEVEFIPRRDTWDF